MMTALFIFGLAVLSAVARTPEETDPRTDAYADYAAARDRARVEENRLAQAEEAYAGTEQIVRHFERRIRQDHAPGGYRERLEVAERRLQLRAAELRIAREAPVCQGGGPAGLGSVADCPLIL